MEKPPPARRLDSGAPDPDITGMARTTSVEDVTGRTANSPRREAPFGAPHAFVLIVIDGDDPKAVHRIVRPETVIGRGGEAHFAIEEEQVSRVHCKIRVDGPVCTIVDCESRNGTAVNGRRLAPKVEQRLRNLDEIEIGSHRLLLLYGRSGQQKKGAA